MNQITFTVAILIISVYQFGYTATLDNNNNNISAYQLISENIEAPLESAFIELINPMTPINYMENLLTRGKSKIKYHELKVNWKEFIKNLDEKKRNPDTIMLKKKKTLA